MKIRRVLVFGGGGFIGTQLVDKLSRNGVEVISFSRHFSERRKGVIYVEGDIRNQSQIEKVIRKKPQAVFLLAGLSGPPYCEAYPSLSFSVNVVAQVNILRFVLRFAPDSQVIFSSSRHEYGRPMYLPVNETHPNLPVSLYGLHKSYVSQMMLFLHRKYKLRTTVLRTANLYGPHLKASNGKYNIVNYFVDEARRRNIVIFGNGLQLRDYLYIDDFIQILTMIYRNEKTAGQVFNIGSGKGTSLVKVAEMITKLAGRDKVINKPWPLNFKEVETGDYISDITKIRNYLNWKISTSIKEGLTKTWKAAKGMK